VKYGSAVHSACSSEIESGSEIEIASSAEVSHLLFSNE
jgi:hypothetical protein